MFLLFLTLFGVFVEGIFSANILFVTIVSSPSHHIWNEALVEGLLAKGHNITLIGHDPARIASENYTVIQITGIEDLNEEFGLGELVNGQKTPFQDLELLWYYNRMLMKLDLQSAALETLLDYPRDFFDLIAYDLGIGQCFYPLIEHFGNPPVVGTSPFALPPYVLDAMGTHFYSYFPIYVIAYGDQMTFFQRVENFLLYLGDYYLKWYVNMPNIYKMAQERFGQDITPFDQVEKRIGILLANYDVNLDFPQPLPPHIIPVGGLHIRKTGKLSNELQRMLDNATEGFIYFSFGTNIQPSWLPTEKKKMFMNTLSKFKQLVVWKYDGDDLENVPGNIIFKKWLPQNNILAHKNIKLFITHGGGLSTQEAVYHHVPVVAIPFYVDQKNNAGKLQTKMLGKKLDLATLTEEILYTTIKEVIDNPTYEENAKKLSFRYRDQPETPMERAVFWTEYALKHKDLSHLSTRARDMTIYQRQNFDIFAFLFFVFSFSIGFVFLLFKCLFSQFNTRKTKRKIKEN